ncbi:MAG: GNAT family N-acetyltransferase, partial [Rubrobacter sp.]
ARRYAGDDGAFSYKNCTVAELYGGVIGMLHAFRMPEEPEEVEDSGDVDPVLEPYARLEVPGSYYVSGMAVFPGLRGKGLGTRMLALAGEQARQSGCVQVSLLAFEQNQGAVELYRRQGFRVIDRTNVVPHESIRYTGEVLLMTATAQ